MLLALAVSLIALPAAANDTPAPSKEKPKASSQVSLRDVAKREAAKTALTTTPAAKSSRRADQSSGTQSTSFFKTRPGAIALAVMAAGTGYAIYSASHDRVSSPAKQ
jgi:hypothetical protein